MSGHFGGNQICSSCSLISDLLPLCALLPFDYFVDVLRLCLGLHEGWSITSSLVRLKMMLHPKTRNMKTLGIQVSSRDTSPENSLFCIS